MEIVNPITFEIIRKMHDGFTIRQIAGKTGFAYSAIYRWVKELEKNFILTSENRGNKILINANKSQVYESFAGLIKAIAIEKKDRLFWTLMKKTNLNARFSDNTAAVIWTEGAYITNDFFSKIYYVEVSVKDAKEFVNLLNKCNIAYSLDRTQKEDYRNLPFVYLIIKKDVKKFKKEDLPVISLKELVSWCKKLELEPILEQLKSIYKLKLNAKYSEYKWLK